MAERIVKDYSHIETPSIPADDPIFTAGVIITAPLKPTAPAEQTADDDVADDEVIGLEPTQ